MSQSQPHSQPGHHHAGPHAPHHAQDLEIDFTRYLEILSRRRWIVALVGLGCLGVTALYAFLATPVYRAATLLNIERAAKSIRTEVDSLTNADEEYFDTQYKLISSDSLLERVFDELKLGSQPEFARDGLKALRERVAVAPVPHTHLCYVQVESVSPELAMNISRTLATFYVEQNLNAQLFMSKDVLDALQMRMHGADAQKVNESLPTVVNNRLIQTIKEQIFTSEAQLADLKMKYTPDHPKVIAAQSRLDKMRKVELNEVDNIVQSLKTDLSGQLQGNNVRIVDPAKLPDRPVRPKKLLALIFGLLGGLAFGCFVAIFVEFLDQTVRTQEDVERRIGLPFLGIIPHTRHRKNAKIYASLVSPEVTLSAEAFRNLRASLGFAEALKGEPAFLVTSTLQSEGKSYVTTGLSVVLAQLGQKVLVIDGDLRRPRQHRNLESSQDKGLSDYLSGAVDDIESIVQKTDVPNLEMIACGPRPSNPAELLHSERLDALMAWARRRYARVIVDCAPIFPVSDALLWGRLVKPAIFVMYFGRTRGPLIHTAIKRIRESGLQLMGGVVNGSRVSSVTYSDGRYYQQYYQDYTDPETTAKSRRS